MRLGFVLLMSVVCGAALADRVILTPNGTRLRPGTIRLETMATAGQPARSWLEAGITTNIDLGLSWVAESGRSPSLDLTWNYLLPITDITPGLSVGVIDFANESPEGRAAYLALTQYFGNLGDRNMDIPTEFSLGVWSRNKGQVFASIVLPFSEEFRLIAEAASGKVNAGFDIRPVKPVSIRLTFLDGKPTAGLRLTQRF